MVKTISRVLILLLVTGFIGFGIYQIIENYPIDQDSPQSNQQNRLSNDDFKGGQPPKNDGFQHGEGHRQGDSSQNWVELFIQAGKITLIVFIIAMAQWVFRVMKKRKAAQLG